MNAKEEIILSYKQNRFVNYYTTSAQCNAFIAYKMAGYTAKNEDAQRAAASRLRSNVNISKKIDQILQAEHADNVELKTKIRRKYEIIAFTDISDVVQFQATSMRGESEGKEKGDAPVVTIINTHVFRVQDLKQIPDNIRPAIKKIKKNKDGFEVELYSSIDAMTALRKMYGFDEPERKEVTGKDGGPLMSFAEIVKEANK